MGHEGKQLLARLHVSKTNVQGATGFEDGEHPEVLSRVNGCKEGCKAYKIGEANKAV